MEADDVGAIYAGGRARLTELARGLGPEQVTAPVPACPEWRVRDVMAHLAGTCADALAGNLDGVTTAAWADAQVAARRDHTVGQILAEWSTVAPKLEAAATQPSRLGTVWILDASVHEHDVRGAVDRPAARDSVGIAIALDFLIAEGLHVQLVGRSLGPPSRSAPASCALPSPRGSSGMVPVRMPSPRPCSRSPRSSCSGP